jgi:hypothetical protein
MPDPHAATVAIPHIPPRRDLLLRAISSVLDQTRPATAISVATDHGRHGAWATRQRALEQVRTPLVAFLDDDDEFLADHLARLVAAIEDGADYAFSWFEVVGGRDPFPGWFFGAPWDPARPRHTTMTVACRTDLACAVGFTPPVPGEEFGNEDWRFLQGCIAAGAKIVHVPARTWRWHHDSGNTRGLPDRW